MEAIILAGGLGTRLRSVVSDVPKPMASVAGRPFLHHLIKYVVKQGVSHIVLSVGYKGDMIVDYFKNNPCGADISFAIEEKPLGTGGAILNSMEKCREDNVFVLNGDTFFAMDYLAFRESHKKSTASFAMALRYLKQNHRYGRAILSNDYIIRFESLSENEPGWINAGIYLINKNLLAEFDLPKKFSFERDFIETNIQQLKPYGFRSDAAFIDIGVPDDYQKASVFIEEIWRSF